MKTNRPINLNLLKLRFPIMAVVSIFHRISGILIFLSLPLVLYAFHASLFSRESFTSLQSAFTYVWVRLLTIMILMSVLYHLLAGIRHIMMDFGMFEGKVSARVTAWVMIVVFILITIIIGGWLW